MTVYMSADKTAKYSFRDHLSKQRADKHNSDLSNLASAMEAVEAQIIELERIKRNIETMAADIETGKVFTVEEVRKVYTEAQKAGRSL